MDNLQKRNSIITNRLNELGMRGHKIDTVLDNINQNAGKNLQEIRAKLMSAREIVISQFARYELQKQKIELVRLQNFVSPYLFGLHRLKDSDIENGLAAVEQTKFEIGRIKQNLTRYDAIEFPRRVLSDKEHFLFQLAETTQSCENLREKLLAKQAVRALEGISPLEEAVKMPLTKDLSHATETFNIQATITDFSETFEELEREYNSLKTEEEIGEKFLED